MQLKKKQTLSRSKLKGVFKLFYYEPFFKEELKYKL